MQFFPTFTAVAMGAMMTAGCQHAKAPVTGHASFQFFEPVPVSSHQAAKQIPAETPTPMMVPAEPIQPLTPPKYPPEALAARAGFATVAVEISVDAEGHVSAVEPSLRHFSVPNRWSDAFQASVEAAVRQWRFRPAQKVIVERVKDPDGNDDLAIRKTENTDWAFNVEFAFNEDGRVVGGTTAGK